MKPKKACEKIAPEKPVTKNARHSLSAASAAGSKNHRLTSSHEGQLPEREIDFAQLDDGSIVEIIEDPVNPNRTKLAIFKGGRIRIADRVENNGEVFLPMSRSTVGFAEVKLPRGTMTYRSVTRLFYNIVNFIQYAVDVPEEYRPVLAAFVIYTWVADRFPIAVYLSIVGLPQSGKTTLLEVLNLICRRPLLVSDISRAAITRACKHFNPTLLIDEIEWDSSQISGTSLQLLRAGSGGSSGVLRFQEIGSSFGPKVLTSLECSRDPALNSRCIQLLITESNNCDLVRPSDPRLVKLAGDLQQQLLRFRFRAYNSIRQAGIPGSENLRPRSRDILQILVAPLVRDLLLRGLLLEFFKSTHDPATREPLLPLQDALLAVLFEFAHFYADVPCIRVKELTEATNARLRKSGERMALSERRTGALISGLGFRSKQRTNQGWILWLNSLTRDHLHQLLKIHGNGYLQNLNFEDLARGCRICTRSAIPPQSRKSEIPRAS